MKIIWKYSLQTETLHTLEVPLGTEVLSVEPHGDEFWLYVLANSKERSFRPMEVRSYATGELIQADLADYTFIGTTKRTDSVGIHVFYRLNEQ